MRLRFLDTALALARRRATWIAAVALAAGGAASGALPLLDAPGYELGMAGALAAVVLGIAAGIAAARVERARAFPSPASAAAAAFLVVAGLLALLLAGSAIRAALGPCRALASAAFFPVLALPSGALASATGAAAAFLARGRRLRATLLAAAAVVLSLAWTLAVAYRGPAAFALDPYLGVWPGPLYDEALAVDARVVLFRLETAALAIALAAAAEVAVRAARRDGSRAIAAASLALAAALAGGVAARVALRALALDGDRGALDRALGGRREGAACTLHLPAEKPAAAADALLAQCEFDAADVARALGLPRPPRVAVWVYRSAAEKRRLVGAAATEYTKPWLGEIHVVDAALPHPVLRHELVHAVGGAIAPGPLGVPARLGVLVSAGLVEGLAVALDAPRSPWTVHEWSRAMRDLGLLPDVAALVGPAGFFGAAPARAYTAAGSFLRFLLERDGPARLAALYRTGDLAGTYGAPVPELVGGWARFLDGVAVPPPLAASAQERFARPSLFARRCAREAAALEHDAGAAAAGGRTAEACVLWRRAAGLEGSAWPLRAAADALARAGDLDEADRAYRDAFAAAGPQERALRTSLVAAEGDLAWRRGDPAGAIARWSAALAATPDRADERLLHAKLAAAADAELSAPALAWLLGTADPATALAAVAQSTHPLAAYLVGRAALSRGEAALALPDLERAAAGRLPAPIALEARFLLGEARCAAGDRAGGAAVLGPLAEGAERAADRERAAIDLRRCAAPPAPNAPATSR